MGNAPRNSMGLFDSVDTELSSGYYGADTISGYNPEVSAFQQDVFGTTTTLPDGTTFLTQPQNQSVADQSDTLFGFDQSKIQANIFDVLNSGVQAASKSALQYASDSINRNANQPGVVGSLLQNFRSTKTGAQITAGSYATKIQAFLGNPIVWLGIGLLVLFLFLRK